MVLIGEGRAKLLFAGEHAVLFGSPAVGVRLPLKTTIAATLDSKNTIRFDTSFDRIREAYPAYISRASETIRSIINTSPSNGMTLTVTSNIPHGSGLGSSSALCVALADFIGKLQVHFAPARHITDTQSLAQQFESIFHGASSGIDCLLSARQSDAITLYGHSTHSTYFSTTTTEPEQKIGVRLEAHSTVQLAAALYCYIVVTKRNSTTKQLIRSLYRLIHDTTKSNHQHMNTLIKINRDYATLLQSDRPTQIAAICSAHNTIHRQLCELNLSSPTVDSMVHAAHAAGVASAKITGAGGGGALLIIFDDAKRWEQCQNELYNRLLILDHNMILYTGLLSPDNQWEIFQQVTG